MADFVRELIDLLSNQPQTTWERTIRLRYGGEERYIQKRDPDYTERVRQLRAAGVPERTAYRRASPGRYK